jgi:hypothetical protein
MKYFRIQHGKHIEITEARFNEVVNKYELDVWCTGNVWYCK